MQEHTAVSLSERFRQLGAPQEFVPELGVPLRWRCGDHSNPFVVTFDPQLNTGFALRMGGEGVDVAFHLDGRIARMLVDRRVVDDPEEQEVLLTALLLH